MVEVVVYVESMYRVALFRGFHDCSRKVRVTCDDWRSVKSELSTGECLGISELSEDAIIVVTPRDAGLKQGGKCRKCDET